MRRVSPIGRFAPAVAAAALLCAGCASSDQIMPGAGGAAATSAPGTSPRPDAVVSAPGVSTPPTGPAASAATGTPPPTGTHAVAAVDGATVSCPDQPYPNAVNDSDQRAPAAPGLAITAVVRCETVQRSYDGLGQWNVQLAEVADRQDFAPLLAQLRKPSAPLTDQPCPAYLRLAPWFAVVDDSGQVARPAIPRDECGQVDGAAVAALQELDFRAVDAVRLAQILSPEALVTGCDQQWKDMIAFEAERGVSAHQQGGGADLASSPASVLVCLYRAGPSEGGMRAGDLVKGVTLSGEAAGRLASEAEIVSALPSGCSDADSFAVVRLSSGPIGYVELGGCHRLLTIDDRLGAASASLVAQLQEALGAP